jgi:hypothetical protein
MGKNMKVLVVAATLVAGHCLINASAAFAQERAGLLTRTQTRAYHECLFDSWIQDYCHANSHAYSQCVVANGGGAYAFQGRLFTDDYCWYAAQSSPPR